MFLRQEVFKVTKVNTLVLNFQFGVKATLIGSQDFTFSGIFCASFPLERLLKTVGRVHFGFFPLWYASCIIQRVIVVVLVLFVETCILLSRAGFHTGIAYACVIHFFGPVLCMEEELLLLMKPFG